MIARNVHNTQLLEFGFCEQRACAEQLPQADHQTAVSYTHL